MCPSASVPRPVYELYFTNKSYTVGGCINFKTDMELGLSDPSTDERELAES